MADRFRLSGGRLKRFDFEGDWGEAFAIGSATAKAGEGIAPPLTPALSEDSAPHREGK